MADFNENQNGVFGEVNFNQNEQAGNVSNGNVFGTFQESNEEVNNGIENNSENFQPIQKDKAITKQGLWSKVKAFLFQDIDLNAPVKIQLTPYQQKVEDEINDFLHQEITFKSITNIFKGKK